MKESNVPIPDEFDKIWQEMSTQTRISLARLYAQSAASFPVSLSLFTLEQMESILQLKGQDALNRIKTMQEAELIIHEPAIHTVRRCLEYHIPQAEALHKAYQHDHALRRQLDLPHYALSGIGSVVADKYNNELGQLLKEQDDQIL